MTDERSAETPTGALTEQDTTELFGWWMDYDEGEANYQDLPPTVEAIVARHVAEAERQLIRLEARNADNQILRDELIRARQHENEVADAVAEMIDALAEAEQKGAREALLSAADCVLGECHAEAHEANCRSRYRSDRTYAHVVIDVVADWLRDRAAQIGGDS